MCININEKRKYVNEKKTKEICSKLRLLCVFNSQY